MEVTIVGPERDRLAVPWTLAACLLLVTVWAAMVLSGEVLLRLAPGSLALPLVSTSVIVALVGFTAVKAGMRGFWTGGERPLLAVVGIVGAVLAKRVFDWPFFAPRGFSVDGAHHGAIVEYLAGHLRFPEGTTSPLDRFAQYPHGGHLLAAMISRTFGVLPLRVLGFLAFLCILMIIAVGGVIASHVATVLADPGNPGSRAPTVAALSVPVLAFAASRFTVGMISQDFFFAQLLALAMVAVGVGVLVVHAGNPFRYGDRFLFVVLALVCGASTMVYPLQIGLLPSAVGLVWLVRRERRWLTGTAVSVLSVVLALAWTVPRLGASRAMAGDEGVIATPRLAELGGLAAALLLCEGLLVVASRGRGDRGRVRPAGVALAGPLLAATTQTVGLLVVRHLPGLPTISRYTAYKNVYLAVPFALMVAAVGAGHAWAATPVLRARTASGALVVALMLYPVAAARYRSDLTNASGPLVHADAYRLLRDSRTSIGAAPVAILASDIEPYALAWTALQRPVSARPSPYLVDQLSVADLPGSGRRYVLVVGRERADRFASGRGFALVRRLGQATLFTATGPVAP